MTLEYRSSLSTRYSSLFMKGLFSEKERASQFRVLWLILAEIEKKLGLPVSQEALDEMKLHLYDIDLDKVAEYEAKTHHDVMAHILAFGDLCPKARSIIHLGATSCYVTDNADVMIYKKGLVHLLNDFKKFILELADLSEKYKRTICVGYTHFQVAQATTMGKRFAMWLQDFHHLYNKLDQFTHNIKTLGIKGATGTQSSFYTLFEGDEQKVEKLDELFSEKVGLKVFDVSGQTYTRLQDSELIHIMAEIGACFHKMGTDIRLLSHTGELAEGFSAHQVGSSAMPHKKNPMLSERLTSLARFLMQQETGSLNTYATQWLERSLDDSAIRRLIMPEAFLTLDALFGLGHKILSKLHVNEAKCRSIFNNSIKDLSQEILLMQLVLEGKDRQDMHEVLKQECMNFDGSFEAYLEHIQKLLGLKFSSELLERLKSGQIFIAMCPYHVDALVAKVRASTF